MDGFAGVVGIAESKGVAGGGVARDMLCIADETSACPSAGLSHMLPPVVDMLDGRVGDSKSGLLNSFVLPIERFSWLACRARLRRELYATPRFPGSSSPITLATQARPLSSRATLFCKKTGSLLTEFARRERDSKFDTSSVYREAWRGVQAYLVKKPSDFGQGL